MNYSTDKLEIVKEFMASAEYEELKNLVHTNASKNFPQPVVLDPHIESLVSALENLQKANPSSPVKHFFLKKIARCGTDFNTSLESGKKAGWLIEDEIRLNERGRALERAIKLVTPLVNRLN